MAQALAQQLLQIAAMYRKRNRCELAEVLYRQVLELQSSAERFDSSETAVALYSLGDVYASTHRELQALPYFKMALRIWNKIERAIRKVKCSFLPGISCANRREDRLNHSSWAQRFRRRRIGLSSL